MPSSAIQNLAQLIEQQRSQRELSMSRFHPSPFQGRPSSPVGKSKPTSGIQMRSCLSESSAQGLGALSKQVCRFCTERTMSCLQHDTHFPIPSHRRTPLCACPLGGAQRVSWPHKGDLQDGKALALLQSISATNQHFKDQAAKHPGLSAGHHAALSSALQAMVSYVSHDAIMNAIVWILTAFTFLHDGVNISLSLSCFTCSADSKDCDLPQQIVAHSPHASQSSSAGKWQLMTCDS